MVLALLASFFLKAEFTNTKHILSLRSSVPSKTRVQLVSNSNAYRCQTSHKFPSLKDKNLLENVSINNVGIKMDESINRRTSEIMMHIRFHADRVEHRKHAFKCLVFVFPKRMFDF